ncbi:MAG: hypothetical protein HY297_05090 [Thaumarchaeota archaeon]|nr:hypothetical protein [Nitrososphaerota archaeon]
MELKPSKGLKVVVNAEREAVFGDESVSVKRVELKDGKKVGVMTGLTLAGFCEVDMRPIDGQTHWYPVEDLVGEHGEKIIEEEIPIEESEEAGQEQEEEPA